MKKILFSTDFSKVSKNAFRFAIEVADDMNAELDIVNIFNVPFPAVDEILPNQVDELIDSEKKIAEEKMDDFIKSVDPNFHGNVKIIYGSFVPEEIIAEVKKSNYELIILGTKGERNTLEKLVGSTTTRTMMNAPCPVLAIPAEAKYKGIGKIAYASDFQPKDKFAVEQLMIFAGEISASLSFVHVETNPEIGQLKDVIAVQNYPFEFTEFSIIKNPSVTKGLDEYLEKGDIDILALFIPKRRLWEQLFHQSFSKKYTFHTKVPLLVFHE